MYVLVATRNSNLHQIGSEPTAAIIIVIVIIIIMTSLSLSPKRLDVMLTIRDIYCVSCKHEIWCLIL